MRLFSATLATETNTFSPLPTNLDAYRESVSCDLGSIHTMRRGCALRRCSSPAGARKMMASHWLKGVASLPAPRA